MFEFQVISANQLSGADRATWLEMQRADSKFESPFFRPEFTAALASIREDIQVAILYHDKEPIGFSPIEVCGDFARPAGYPLNSFHGVVTSRNGWMPEAILPAIGVDQFRFDHWIPDQSEVESSTSVRAISRQIDLSNGFDEYVEAKKQAGSKLYLESQRLMRKLTREVGPVRCVRSKSSNAIALLVKWNAHQCTRTGFANLFDFDWTVELLRHLAEQAAGDFGGILWELYAGDSLIAVNYVLRSAHVGHGWFMSFDWDFGRYSPGTILLHELLRECEELGITRFDLGKGSSQFKERMMTHSLEVAEGAIDTRLVTSAAWSQWLKTRDWVRNSKLRNSAHRVDRWLTNTRRIFGGKA